MSYWLHSVFAKIYVIIFDFIKKSMLFSDISQNANPCTYEWRDIVNSKHYWQIFIFSMDFSFQKRHREPGVGVSSVQ